jgi:RimJ/RimL family protein N-acetyltransferase
MRLMSYKQTFLESEKIFLSMFTEEDYSKLVPEWYCDKDVTQFLSRGTLPPVREKLVSDWKKSLSSDSEFEFSIVDKSSGKTIGLAGLHGVNWISRHGEFRILIGDKSYWGTGRGAEVCQLLVAYGFEALGLNKVWLGVNAANKRAHDSYLKVGFKNEGILRQELYKNGKFFDIIRLSILRSEYVSLKKAWSTYSWIAKQYPE